jgi:hypothetical protein
MAYEHIIDPKLELRERCRALKRLENAMGRSNVVIRMRYLDAEKRVCRFEAIEGPEIEALPVEEKQRLADALPLARRAVDRFRAELFADACRTPGGYIYHNYWAPRRTEKRNKKIRRTAIGEGMQGKNEKSKPRQFFDTFDDCSSVWTLPSNWKKKES